MSKSSVVPISEITRKATPEMSTAPHNRGDQVHSDFLCTQVSSKSQIYAAHNSDLIQSLHCGSFVELLADSKWMKAPTWKLAKVLKIYRDGNLLRCVKV